MSSSSAYDELAARYHEEVISPFARGVEFPFHQQVKRLLSAWRQDGSIRRRKVVDFGCGCGDGLVAVAGRAGLSAGIDFSGAMLDQSQRRLEERGLPVRRYRQRGGLKRLARRIAAFGKGRLRPHWTFLVQADLQDLSPIRGAVDLGLALDSLSAPDAGRAEKMARQVAASISAGGTLIGLYQSMESMEYLHDLARRGSIELEAIATLDRGRQVYRDPSGFGQKLYRRREICELVESEGLAIERLEKVRYPWKLMGESGWGYFPRHRRLWDWYVSARRIGT